MEYIDKRNYYSLSTDYEKFENEAWNSQDNRYYNYYYDNLKFKNKLKQELSAEQNHKCCYCMGNIMPNNTTLEHIYPQNPIGGDNLGNYGITCIDTQNFNYNNREIPNANGTNLPHDISYYNLVASCDSKISCNNKRGNQKIEPLFFDKDISTKIQYDKDGNIFSTEYKEEIIILGLAGNELTKIRKLWKHLSKKYPSGNYTEDDIKETALEIANDYTFYISFVNDNRKIKKVLKYNYFFDKFK